MKEDLFTYTLIGMGSCSKRLAVDSLGIQQQACDEDDDDCQELQESHSDERVREQVLLHGWVAGHADHESCEQLADTLCATTHCNHCNGTAKHRHACMALAHWCTQSDHSCSSSLWCSSRRFLQRKS